MDALETNVDGSEEQRDVASKDAAVSILVSEFEFVAGLIPYYRRLEITALAGTGLILSGLLAAWAALLGEGADEDARRTLSVVLSVAAWGPTLLVLVELMALVRVTRASSYVQHHLHPLAADLTKIDDLLRWEFGPTKWLEQEPIRHVVVRVCVSSAPIIVAIGIPAVVLPVAGLRMGAEPWALLVGFGAAAVAVVVAAYGAWETTRHELRRGAAQPANVDAAAALRAR